MNSLQTTVEDLNLANEVRGDIVLSIGFCEHVLVGYDAEKCKFREKS
jgi:hypothetical protein